MGEGELHILLLCHPDPVSHDLQEVYLDSFMDVAFIKDKSEIGAVLEKLDKISEKFCVDLIISVSLEVSEVPEKFKSQVIVAL